MTKALGVLQERNRICARNTIVQTWHLTESESRQIFLLSFFFNFLLCLSLEWSLGRESSWVPWFLSDTILFSRDAVPCRALTTYTGVRVNPAGQAARSAPKTGFRTATRARSMNSKMPNHIMHRGGFFDRISSSSSVLNDDVKPLSFYSLSLSYTWTLLSFSFIQKKIWSMLIKKWKKTVPTTWSQLLLAVLWKSNVRYAAVYKIAESKMSKNRRKVKKR